MKVCVSGSTRFKDRIVEISKSLDKLGIKHFLPVIKINKENETPEMVPRLVYEHLEKLQKASKLFVVNPGGYIGSSVKIEIGYAKGLGKKIYFLEKTGHPELDCLADSFISENYEELR